MRTPLELLRLAADRAFEHEYTVWRFGEGVAMEGLLAAAELTGDTRHRQNVAAIMDGWIATRSALIPNDHTAGGTALVRLYEVTKDTRWSGRGC